MSSISQCETMNDHLMKQMNFDYRKKINLPFQTGQVSGHKHLYLWWRKLLKLNTTVSNMENEQEQEQSRSQNPRVFWSAPRHGALE